MKIVKRKHTETWFSPKRYMRETTCVPNPNGHSMKDKFYCLSIPVSDERIIIAHRKDGPAVISSKALYWYKNDCETRSDGPAFEVIGSNSKTYYINDVSKTEEEYWNK